MQALFSRFFQKKQAPFSAFSTSAEPALAGAEPAPADAFESLLVRSVHFFVGQCTEPHDACCAERHRYERQQARSAEPTLAGAEPALADAFDGLLVHSMHFFAEQCTEPQCAFCFQQAAQSY